MQKDSASAMKTCSRRWRLPLRGLLLFLGGIFTGIVAIFVFDMLLRPPPEVVQREMQVVLLKDTLYNYLTNEGPANRGEEFSKFVLLLDGQMKQGLRLSEAQFLNYAGKPDLTKEEGPLRCMEFTFNRFGNKDWAIYVDIKNGEVQQFGYGLAQPAGAKEGSAKEAILEKAEQR